MRRSDDRLFSRMRRAAIGLILACMPYSGQAAGTDPLFLYDGELAFDVMRDGQRVGHHVSTFSGGGNRIVAVHRFELEIRFFIFTYDYLYESVGTWQDGELIELVAQTDDNGDTSSVTMMRSGDAITISGPEGLLRTTPPLYPTNHWHAGVLTQPRVLNTITGAINAVRIEKREREAVETELGPVVATRYAYTGDLQTEVWYDDAGRWVKMRFKGRDGTMIDYVCRRCQGGTVKSAEE